jgi:hypothetical protein
LGKQLGKQAGRGGLVVALFLQVFSLIPLPDSPVTGDSIREVPMQFCYRSVWLICLVSTGGERKWIGTKSSPDVNGFAVGKFLMSTTAIRFLTHYVDRSFIS